MRQDSAFNSRELYFLAFYHTVILARTFTQFVSVHCTLQYTGCILFPQVGSGRTNFTMWQVVQAEIVPVQRKRGTQWLKSLFSGYCVDQQNTRNCTMIQNEQFTFLSMQFDCIIMFSRKSAESILIQFSTTRQCELRHLSMYLLPVNH